MSDATSSAQLGSQICLVSNRSCHYPLAVIPLRDRRMMQKNALPPGQQAPWAFVQPQSAIIDPFDTLPVKTPFRSRELYHYFYQTGAAFSVAPPDPKNDCITLATLDEHALRSTFLIAAVHYSWNTGNLQAYEAAYLFHKVESIRLINNWLAAYDANRFVVCVRQILTICLAEACLGNIPAAETHLDGVMALFDSHDAMVDSTMHGTVSDIPLDRELADHYLFLTSCFVLTLKSRLGDFIMYRATQGLNTDTNNNDSSPDQAIKLYQKWHGMEHGGLETRLKAMRLFPYFFTPPPPNIPRSKKIVVDAVPIIACLVDITETLDQARASKAPPSETMHRVWNDGGLTRLLLVLVTSHVDCFVADYEQGFSQNEDRRTRTSWGGISAAAELYMHGMLGVVNNGKRIECRLLYRILCILQRDVEETRCDIFVLTDKHGLLRSLWLWKVFMGIMAIARSQHACELVPPRSTATADPDPRARCSCSNLCQERLQSAYDWFLNCARSWSMASGMTAWEDVESVLAEIVWPRVLHGQERQFAAGLWDRVLL
ncbi:uncharacterized protein BDV14DRAFT_196780 [Aspergillus stella-maris]|uniref:uncharacterized protein n=1 Tax=Aspergillus stella-maris TaxID=1810926 RepID=UPI003CCDA3F2